MGSTALYDDSAAELTRLRQHRLLVLAQIDRVIQGGQSFGGGGLMTINQVPLAELRRDLATTELAILRITNGAESLTIFPDFSGETTTNENTL